MRLSTNIESAEDIRWAREDYYPTQQCRKFIGELSAKALLGGAAFALEGSYGSGKSSLLAFALNQVTRLDDEFPPINASDLPDWKIPQLISLNEAGGLTPLVFTGSTDSLASKILSVLKIYVAENPNAPGSEALRISLSKHRGKSPQVRALECLRTFAETVHNLGSAGLLLAIDEFGRHLDQMLTPGGSGDLHLLQEIAESTGRMDAPLTLVIVQHHGLDHYADRILGDYRTEWEKVRGRFRETVLQNSEAETARIIAYALRSLHPHDDRKVQSAIPPSKSKSAPSLMSDSEFLAACVPCRPLHPMTIVLLARLARLLGQQDRTVVGWLTSVKPTGFTAVRDSARGGWIRPDTLFDHFFDDVLKTPSNPIYARRLATIHGAWERVGDDLDCRARSLFKVMAILSFCSGDGISANRGNALACLPARFPFADSIERLVSRALLVHREFRGEYVVWEGSDYDILGKIDTEMSIIELDAAEEMNKRFTRPVLAHRHFIETGNRRTARLMWLNSEQPAPPSEEGPRILVGLDTIPKEAICEKVDVRSSIPSTELLPHLKASATIRRLLEEDTDLLGDKVATKEMRIRLEHHDNSILAIAEERLASSKTRWKLSDVEFASIQEAATAAMDKAYPKAFDLHLDMFNRDRLSGPASAAFRKLIEAMLSYPSLERFGIERFPAERILYEAFVRSNRLHVRDRDGTWRLNMAGRGIPIRVRQAFAELRQQFAKESTAKSVDDAILVLGDMPFGIKRNPALLLCVIFLLIEKDRYELYESGSYLPDWGPKTLVRLVKAPQRFNMSATTDVPFDGSFMLSYRKALAGESKTYEDITPISVARAALQRHAKLSNYARATQSVPEAARNFRRAFRVAKSPGDMLFRTIPTALGYHKLPSHHSATEEYLARVLRARAALEGADATLLNTLGDVVMDSLGKEPLSEARKECVSCAEYLLQDSRIHHGYGDFVGAVLGDRELDDISWLARVVDDGLGIRLPLESWTDAHVAQAEFTLRRTLLSIQEAGRMLEHAEVARNAVPFVIFLPGKYSKDETPEERQAEAILASAPDAQRMAIITNLAQKFKETV